MGFIEEPIYAVSFISVGFNGGLFNSLLYLYTGSTLASAPVSNLQVMLPRVVTSVDSHIECCMR